MKELQIKIRPREEDICYFPEDFQKVKFLGLELNTRQRYFRVNWASSENNNAFWYPFVGGTDATLYTDVRAECDMNRLLRAGCRFYSFETAEEMYRWLGHSK